MESNDVLIELVRAIPVTVVGGIAAYVAYQQWKTNQQRLRLDLYDRRLRIYQEVRNLIAMALDDLRTQNLLEFDRATAEAAFLFGPGPGPINRYLEELFAHGKALVKWNQEFRDDPQLWPPGYDHNAVINGMAEERMWFAEQPQTALQTFRDSLNVRA